MSYQQNIIDAVLVLDYDLNVVDANRSFLRYVNIPNPGFNLSTKLSKIENDTSTINIDLAKRICEALDITLDYLVYGK